MQSPVHIKLSPVRQRQRWSRVVQSAAVCLLVSALAGVALGAARVLGAAVSLPLALGVLAVGPILGAIAAALVRRPWHDAATAVDAHYDLKDRATSALEFLARPALTPLQQLEVRDTVEHLEHVEPNRVVPWQVPRTLPWAAGALAAAAVLCSWPLPPAPVAAQLAAPPATVLEQADQLAEDLRQLDELAKQDRDKELEKLVRELTEKVEEMKQPGTDVREALAKLSEMQATISAQQAQYNVGLVDGQLQSLGAALSVAAPLEGAGKALQEAKFDRAAEELDELEDPKLERKEAQTVEEKLKQVADKMGELGLGQLSDAASEMAAGIKGGQKSRIRKGSRQLADLVRGHSRRRRLNQFLTIELTRLSECKNCLGKQCDRLATGKKPEKSLSPSSTFGLTTSGNVIGDKTNMLAKRNLQEITGNPGDGPAEMETTHSPEGREQAGRSLREIYQQYQKMSETVLDSEPIPLGHRETIRRYFSLIRPQNVETSQ